MGMGIPISHKRMDRMICSVESMQAVRTCQMHVTVPVQVYDLNG